MNVFDFPRRRDKVLPPLHCITGTFYDLNSLATHLGRHPQKSPRNPLFPNLNLVSQ